MIPEISIVLPCLNEAATIENCINMGLQFLRQHTVIGEIIVADNGSSDASPEIIEKMGVKRVNVFERGYGNALKAGIDAACGEYIIMGDADDSYDLLNLMPFVEKLREGYEFVIGNRFIGEIKPGAMPFIHKYFGNPFLSGLGNLLFNSPAGDFHCGLRGFRRNSLLALDLQSTGMEYCTEMIIKATKKRMKITEVPTTLSPDGRNRSPHLKTWNDGWKNLIIMLRLRLEL
jgi:glycosyltransferase involved in cell wall biosynthesis